MATARPSASASTGKRASSSPWCTTESFGFRHVVTEVKAFYLDNRTPAERAEFLAYWTSLLLSGAPAPLAASKVSQESVDGMTRELERVARAPNSVFFYSFIQARARAW